MHSSEVAKYIQMFIFLKNNTNEKEQSTFNHLLKLS